MNWTLLSVSVTALLLVWRLALDFVPMFPLNDLERRSPLSRKRNWTVHYVPLAITLALSLSTERLSVATALLVALTYAAVQAVSCWFPYWLGGTETQKTKWDRVYGRTHRFLPPIHDHSIPDTAHVISGVLTLLMVIVLAGHLWSGAGGKAAPKEAEAAEAAVKAGAPTVETAFTQAGHKPEQLLIETIRASKAALDIAINAINHEDIVNTILDARIRGVQVRVITDRTESTNAPQSEQLKRLLEAGVPVKENTRKGLMDLKMSIIDDQAATTGSFNYTVNAATNNDEMLVVIRDTTTIKQWKQQFEAMWNDTQNFRELKLGVVPKKS